VTARSGTQPSRIGSAGTCPSATGPADTCPGIACARCARGRRATCTRTAKSARTWPTDSPGNTCRNPTAARTAAPGTARRTCATGSAEARGPAGLRTASLTRAARLRARATCRAASSCTRVGRRVDDCLDTTVDADRIDHRLAKNLVAAGPREALPRTGVHQTECQRLVVDRDDLSVLTQHDPGEPPLRLDGFQDLGPQPPNVSQPNTPTGRHARLTGGRSTLAGRSRLRGLAWLRALARLLRCAGRFITPGTSTRPAGRANWSTRS